MCSSAGSRSGCNPCCFPARLLEAVGEWDPGFTVSEDWDYVLRAAELAPARNDRAVATWYRDHSGGLTSDTAAGRDGALGVVEGYFGRHPDQRGTALERRAHAMLYAHAARVDATHGRPLRALRPLLRACVKDPRAIGGELTRGSVRPCAATCAAGCGAAATRRGLFRRSRPGQDRRAEFRFVRSGRCG